ncbi:HlyD family secretion protein [Consotaella salsifontis]|uniref:Multidrug resistance efflux pump n=1 Tax=Consotaella salsifontis TaxID=1365950 RepID=A0A1T4PW45_9HYPH|nr:HlyD family secretion protein [Consotaella salsifontis]SJZ95780.1 Multidrug resistance efflux pump [Consotaella salsifontis]
MNRVFRSISTYVALLVGVAGVLLVLYAWNLPPFHTSVETTNNAYVRGQVTTLSPQITGIVTEVPVKDYQRVKEGDLLVKLDDRIYRQKLDQAKATLESQKAALGNSEQDRRSAEASIRSYEAQVTSAKAALESASSNWERIEPLAKKGVMTSGEAISAESKFRQAEAAVKQAEAALDVAKQKLQSTIVGRRSLEAAVASAEAAVHLAEIDLQNTRITAPRDGTLGEVGAHVGQYATAGSQLVSIVPDAVWVVANFKETQLPHMKPGQRVTFTVDALADTSLSGTIERFSPAAGSEFSVIKSDNATGNFTKIAQRIPVRIGIDADQPLAERLVPGMSVEVSVDTAQSARQTTLASNAAARTM